MSLPPQVNSSFEMEARRLRDELQARLAAIIESSDDAIVSKTLDGIITTWNAGAERVFGYKAEEVVGRPILVIIPPDRMDEEPRILARLRAGERVDHFETVRLTKDGRHVDVSVTISPVRDSTGRIIGASKIARDVTEQKRIRRELAAAKEAAEAASRAKDQFLSVLSHELRTPLTPALAALSLLERRDDVAVELRDELAMVRRNIETEARLVDDLLDLTRLHRGKIELHFEPVDAHAALRGALAMVHDEADAKRLELTTALRADRHHVWADPGRLQQVFLNLLSNAVKFTPEGGRITIRSADDAEGQRVRLEVQDTGIGIAPDVLPRLFNPFEQADQRRTRETGGVGLGLTITRSLLEMQRGTVWASSEGVGRGATFTVELETIAPPAPVAAPAAAAAATSAPASAGGAAPAPTPAPASTCHVLLVEDHLDTRRVMSKLLTTFGCTVRAAGTVAEALAALDAEPFDLLISDIGLPDGSGTDIMRRLRDAGRPPVKAIALTGFSQDDDVRRSREAGFDVHLTKPINFQTLKDVIRDTCGMG